MNILFTTLNNLSELIHTITLPTITLPEMNFELPSIPLPSLPTLPTMEFSLTSLLLVNSMYILTLYSYRCYRDYQQSSQIKSYEKTIDGHYNKISKIHNKYNDKVKSFEEIIKDNETLIHLLQKRRNPHSNMYFTHEDIAALQQQISNEHVKYLTSNNLQEEIEFELENEKAKSNNLQNDLSFLEHEYKQYKESSKQSYRTLKDNNKTLKNGCKDLINKLNNLTTKNEDLQEEHDNVVDEYNDLLENNETLEQEIVNINADHFDKDTTIEKLSKMNKILETEITERKVEVLKLRKLKN